MDDPLKKEITVKGMANYMDIINNWRRLMIDSDDDAYLKDGKLDKVKLMEDMDKVIMAYRESFAGVLTTAHALAGDVSLEHFKGFLDMTIRGMLNKEMIF